MKFSLFITGMMMIVVPAVSFSQQRLTVEEYIEKYKGLAIKEMDTYHIPASITLAQGILESENGNSPLAKEANNHFGIKCHKEWTGKTYIQDDDEKNECFRCYKEPEESFRDHSEFLTTRDRYSFLFSYDITDYKSWAYGLKQAGYATNPRYPEMLIKIIEENGLAEFDMDGGQRLAVSGQRSAVGGQQSAVGNQKSEMKSTVPSVFEFAGRGGNDRVIFLNNGVKFILAREGDDFEKIASEFEIYTWQLYKYNEMTRQEGPEPGQKIYLEKKRGKGDEETYTVSENDDLRSISQDFGIRLKALCRMNGKEKTDGIKPGEVLRMK
jgi:hypothetical protein